MAQDGYMSATKDITLRARVTSAMQTRVSRARKVAGLTEAEFIRDALLRRVESIERISRDRAGLLKKAATT